MKLALHLNDINYVYDYKSMGVELFIVGSDYSYLNELFLNYDELKDLKQKLDTQKVYVLVNGLYDDYELEGLFKHIDTLNDLKIDGLLFQDFGVLQYVKTKNYAFDMMYSPLTLNTNSYTLNILQKQGITSAFIAKEIPLEEQVDIQSKATMPLMIQCHGIQYMASSKRHLLSTYKEASNKSFDTSISSNLKIIPRSSDTKCYIYEDQRGTSIFTESRLYTLDLLNTLACFDYLYIETLKMSQEEALEVTSLYSDAIKEYYLGDYNHRVKELLPLLRKISSPLDRGFIEDSTVYRLEDMKKRDL